MNVDDNIAEAYNVLELSLGYSNQRIHDELDAHTGAGANAGSKIDMAFVGTDSLSELVWSPQKGLSIKCADGSFSQKKPYFFRVAEPINMVGSSSTDRAIDKANFMSSLENLNMHEGEGTNDPISLVASHAGVMPVGHTSDEIDPVCGKFLKSPLLPAIDQVEEPKTEMGLSLLLEEEDPGKDKVEDQINVDIAANDPSSVEPIITAGGGDHKEDDSGNHMKRTEGFLALEGHPVKGFEDDASEMPKETEVSHSFSKESKINSDPGPSGCHLLKKRESTTENDLQTPLGKTTRSVASLSESSSEVKIILPQDNELPAKDSTPAYKESSSSKVQRNRRKGKGKALSDGNDSERKSNEEGNSYETVESCYSGRLISTGKKQGSFEQSLINRSKRLKRHIDDSPSSPSFVRQDSSFMNWISNMTKGFMKSKETSMTSLALSLPNPEHGNKVPKDRVLACHRDLDLPVKPVGFHSFFGSLYRPKRLDQETVALNPSYHNDEYKEFKRNENICDANPMPITCCTEAGSSYKQFKLPNEMFNGSTSGNGTGPVVQAKNSSMKFASHQEAGSGASTGNKSSSNLPIDKDRNETSDSSEDKHEADLGKDIDNEQPFERKTNKVCGYRSDMMTSSWIARFAPKVPVSYQKQDLCNPSTSEFPACSADGMSLKHPIHNHLSSSNINKELTHRENLAEVSPCAQNCGADTKTSFGFFKVKSCHDEKSVCQLNPLLPSPRINHSEARTSVFARRLDVLRHIKPSDASDGSFPGARNQAEVGSSFASEMSNIKLIESGDNQFQAASKTITCDGNDSGKGKDSNWSSYEDDFSQHEDIKSFEEDTAKGFQKKESEMRNFMSFYTPVAEQSSDTRKFMFDAVKRLQLSRTDILKWMNSHMPLSHLNGFYLRLRLGKWDEGLGGTGYHVACINGEANKIATVTKCFPGVQGETMPHDSKNTIAVDVGGIKCLVESQYISNHDFLEDELVTWWSSISKGGGKIPSKENLKLKFEEKKLLGL